jgi:hypothetical protein
MSKCSPRGGYYAITGIAAGDCQYLTVKMKANTEDVSA